MHEQCGREQKHQAALVSTSYRGRSWLVFEGAAGTCNYAATLLMVYGTNDSSDTNNSNTI